MAAIGINDLPTCIPRRKVDGVSRYRVYACHRDLRRDCCAVFRTGPGRGAGPGHGAGAPPGRGRAAGPGYPKFFDSNMPFQPRDLAGIWTPNGNGFGGGGRCRDCGDRGFSMEFPVFTPAGQAAFERNTPSYGRAKDSDDAKAHPEEHIGRRRAQPPALGNDTYGTCNPMGMPRAALYPDPVELHRACPIASCSTSSGDTGCARSGWMDGSCRRRKTSTFLDGGAMPSAAGTATRWSSSPPAMTSARGSITSAIRTATRWCCEERYTRINYDTIELKMTLTDPKYYAKPWTSETKRMHLLPKTSSSRRDGRAARGSLRAGERAGVQPAHSRPGGHRQAGRAWRKTMTRSRAVRLVRRRSAGMSDGTTLAVGSPRHAGVVRPRQGMDGEGRRDRVPLREPARADSISTSRTRTMPGIGAANCCPIPRSSSPAAGRASDRSRR